MKESEQIGEIDPESAIQATGIETPIHERVMPLHHHESFAFQAVHRPTLAPLRIGFVVGPAQLRPIPTSSLYLAESIEDQGEAAGQQPAPEDCGAKGEDRARTSRRVGPGDQIAHPTLNHQDCQRRQAAHAKPPQKRSHEPPRSSS
jgi:hypothetical protein